MEKIPGPQPAPQEKLPFIPPDVVEDALCYAEEGMASLRLTKNPDGVTYSDEKGNTFEWRDAGRESGYYLTRTAESPEVTELYERALANEPNADAQRKDFLLALARERVRSRRRAEYLKAQKAAKKKQKKSGKK